MSGAAHRLMCVTWPAFLGACVLEALVFSLVDPHELHWFGHPLDWSRQAMYTASFFVFWGVQAAVGWLAVVLAQSRPGEGAR